MNQKVNVSRRYDLDWWRVIFLRC